MASDRAGKSFPAGRISQLPRSTMHCHAHFISISCKQWGIVNYTCLNIETFQSETSYATYNINMNNLRNYSH